MKSREVLTALLLAVFPIVAVAQPKAVFQTPEQIAALAPVIKLSSGRIQSLAFRAALVPDEPLYHLSLLARKPDVCTLLVRDGTDETPLLLVADGHVLVYDLSGHGVMVMEGQPGFELNNNGEKMNFNFAFVASAANPEYDQITIDLRSIIDRAQKNRRVAPAGRSRFEFTGETALGSRIVATVDPSLFCPFTRMDIYSRDIARPVLRIQQLDVNEPLPPKRVRFPDEAALAARLPVRREKTPLDRDGYVRVMGKLAMTVACRRALRHPEQRKIVGARLPADTDWDVMQKEDARMSADLRELIGGASVATQPATRPQGPSQSAQ